MGDKVIGLKGNEDLGQNIKVGKLKFILEKILNLFTQAKILPFLTIQILSSITTSTGTIR